MQEKTAGDLVREQGQHKKLRTITRSDMINRFIDLVQEELDLGNHGIDSHVKEAIIDGFKARVEAAFPLPKDV